MLSHDFEYLNKEALCFDPEFSYLPKAAFSRSSIIYHF